MNCLSRTLWTPSRHSQPCRVPTTRRMTPSSDRAWASSWPRRRCSSRPGSPARPMSPSSPATTPTAVSRGPTATCSARSTPPSRASSASSTAVPRQGRLRARRQRNSGANRPATPRRAATTARPPSTSCSAAASSAACGQAPATDPAHRLNDALVPTVDFRSVYATALNRLSGDPNQTATILKGPFADLGIFSSGPAQPPAPPSGGGSTTTTTAPSSPTPTTSTTMPGRTGTEPPRTWQPTGLLGAASRMQPR